MADNAAPVIEHDLKSAETGASSTLRRRYWRFRSAGTRAVHDLLMRRRLTSLRRRARAAVRFQPGSLRLDGYRIRYDDLLSLYMEYKHIFAWGIYDFRPETARPLVLDCGSHIGLSILRFKRIAPDARVIGFEPDPRLDRILEENVRDNELADVEIVPAAVSSKRGTCRFVSDCADGGALSAGGAESTSAVQVRSVPLSDYLDEPVEMLKMNIEGSEWEALREAESKLRNVKRMVIEYHGLPELGQKLHEILALLDRCGFRYMLHHFDYETNAAVRPPFRLNRATRFFLLIVATRGGPAEPAGAGAAGLGPLPLPAASGVTSASPSPTSRGAVEPLSRKFGLDRGQPIDRYYIEAFLHRCRYDVRGRVLEVGDDAYTRRFGEGRVTRSDVLNPAPAPGTTLVADLSDAGQLPERRYDCVILTQVLPFIFDLRAVVENCRRLLKPGGVLLATVPGISQISRYDMERWGDYWRFTPASLRRLLSGCFPPEAIEVGAHGNVRAASAFLYGLAEHELTAEELNYVDEDYPITITARAVRPP